MNIKFIKLGISVSCLLLASSNIANALKSCAQIHKDYIQTVKEYLTTVEKLQSNPDIPTALKDSLASAVSTLTSGNYTYPSLKTINGAIQDSTDFETLNSLVTAAGKNVSAWKEKRSPEPCREQKAWRCDLGEPGTPCGNQ